MPKIDSVNYTKSNKSGLFEVKLLVTYVSVFKFVKKQHCLKKKILMYT